MPRSLAVCVVALALVVPAACATARGADEVAAGIRSRTGASIDLGRTASEPATIPENVRIDDGLSVEEAVAIAVWNSPTLRVDLARLTAADAELAQARRPSNPTLRFLFPAGPQQLSVLLTWPLETLITMGPGVPADERAAMFEPFHRGPSARSLPGHGLGLALVAHVVRAYGGRVEFVAGRARGACVRIELPSRSNGAQPFVSRPCDAAGGC